MTSEGIVAVLAAVGVLIGAGATAFIKVLREVRKVHKIVNQQRTDMQSYQWVLTDSLRAHGIAVPRDKSVEG